MMTPAKLIRKVFYEKKGYTLVEVIIASTIFTMVGVMGLVVFVNVLRIQRKIDLENAIYEDGRFLMERISREIRQNSIDYEEYYNETTGKKLGEFFGCYAKQFYNPGSDLVLGALCNDGYPVEQKPGCTVDKSTLDINTGEHPYPTLFSTDSSFKNAFCTTGTPACKKPINYMRDRLDLISSDGTQKTIITSKKIKADIVPANDEYAVSMLRLTGKDVNRDGITEKWVDISGGTNFDYSDYCNPGYDCDFTVSATPEDNLIEGANLFEGFVPISPLRTNVENLQFFVAPMEDPRKAFAETNTAENIQQQPHVTVVMTLTPSADQLTNFAGEVPKITLQTTVTSRVNNEVKSYYPEVSALNCAY